MPPGVDHEEGKEVVESVVVEVLVGVVEVVEVVEVVVVVVVVVVVAVSMCSRNEVKNSASCSWDSMSSGMCRGSLSRVGLLAVWAVMDMA